MPSKKMAPKFEIHASYCTESIKRQMNQENGPIITVNIKVHVLSLNILSSDCSTNGNLVIKMSIIIYKLNLNKIYKLIYKNI